MAVLRMTVERWQRYHAQLGERYHAAALLGIRSAGHRIVALMVQRTREAKPASPNGAVGAVNTGGLARGWTSMKIDDGVRVLNPKQHSPIAEYGRRPGVLPPIKVIERWLIRRVGLTKREAREAAWPVAMAIKARGLLGREILTGPEAEAQIEGILDAEVRHELDRALAEPP